MNFSGKFLALVIGGLLVSTVSAESVPEYRDVSSQLLRQQIDGRLNTATSVADRYQLEKAAAWLTYADHEYSERGFTPAGKEAYEQAYQLLNAPDKAGMGTRIIPSSQVMRRDLWLRAEQIKSQPGLSCTHKAVAQAEVNLVWAAAEYCELGWRHSREIFASAERLLDQAGYAAEQCGGASSSISKLADLPSIVQLNGSKGCAGVNPDLWPLRVATAPLPAVPAEPEEVPQSDVLKIRSTVHFALDKSNLSIDSRAVLKEIAQLMKEHPEWSVTLYGFTDGRANVAYNMKLSERRAASVRTYLIHEGVKPERIATEAKGKSSLIDHEDVIESTALSRRVEMHFVDADGKEIKTESQYTDLQKEKR